MIITAATLIYRRPTFFVKVFVDNQSYNYPIKSHDEYKWRQLFATDMDMLRNGLLPKGSTIPAASIYIEGDYVHVASPLQIKNSLAQDALDKWDYQQEQINNLVKLLTKIQHNCLHKLPPELKAEVTSMVKKHAKTA